MKHNVVLADDSLTIQKVINITLANEPFEMVVCEVENELPDVLTEYNPALVLLDFNLSEEKDGYELCKEIKQNAPSARVLMMYGNFDTIDESKFAECGADDKIVKPFDGARFIDICRSLVDGVEASAMAAASEPIAEDPVMEEAQPEEMVVPQEMSRDAFEEEAEPVLTKSDPDSTVELRPDEILSQGEEEALDAWSVDDSAGQSIDEEPVDNSNKLQEMASEWNQTADAQSNIDSTGWEIEVPEVIAMQGAEGDIIAAQEEGGEGTLPSDDDLEYPDMDAEVETRTDIFPEEIIEEAQDEPIEESGPQLTPASELIEPEPQLTPASDLVQPEIEPYTGEYEVEGLREGAESEEDVAKIESQIEDEVGGDMWAVDQDAPASDMEEVAMDDSVEESVAAFQEEGVSQEDYDDIDTPLEDMMGASGNVDLAALEEEAKKEQERQEAEQMAEVEVEIEEEIVAVEEAPQEGVAVEAVEASSVDLAALEEEVKKEQAQEDEEVVAEIEEEVEEVVAEPVQAAEPVQPTQTMQPAAGMQAAGSDVWDIHKNVEEAIERNVEAAVHDYVVNNLPNLLREKVEQAVAKYIQNDAQGLAEKVLWEMAPDIAENVVKTELQRIGQRVLMDYEDQ
jgi:DNA-binding NarL/FixJ family response regulator